MGRDKAQGRAAERGQPLVGCTGLFNAGTTGTRGVPGALGGPLQMRRGTILSQQTRLYFLVYNAQGVEDLSYLFPFNMVI